VLREEQAREALAWRGDVINLAVPWNLNLDLPEK